MPNPNLFAPTNNPTPSADKDPTTVPVATDILNRINPDHLPVRGPEIVPVEYLHEDWAPVPGYPAYEVSTLGRFRRAADTDAEGEAVPAVHLNQSYAGRAPIYARVRGLAERADQADPGTLPGRYRGGGVMARCPTPRKASFHDRGVAAKALREIRESRRYPDAATVPRRYYRCRCRKWHLTRKTISY